MAVSEDEGTLAYPLVGWLDINGFERDSDVEMPERCLKIKVLVEGRCRSI